VADARVLYYCDAAIDHLGRSSGMAVVVRDGERRILDAASCYMAGMTSNEAEYEAVILGLRLALVRRDGAISLLTDSRIVVGQVSGSFAVRDPRLLRLRARVTRLLARLPDATLAFVPRESNGVADAMAREAMLVGAQVARRDRGKAGP